MVKGGVEAGVAREVREIMPTKVDRLDRSLGGTRVFLIVSCGNVEEASKFEKELRKFLNAKI